MSIEGKTSTLNLLMINTNYLEDNGVSTFVIGNCKLLANKGVDVSIVAPNHVNSNIKTMLKDNGIRLYEIPQRKSHPLKYFWKLLKIINNSNFGILHVNGNSGTMVIEILAGLMGHIKVRIVHSHNTKTSHPFLNKVLNPYLEMLATHRFACNKAAGKSLFGNRKYWVIKNGIDLKNYQYKEYNKKEKRKIVLGNVGRFNFQKNQDFLIDLIKLLGDDYTLLLIGNGDKLESIKEKVKKLKLKDSVIFTGTVDNVYDYLNKMDVFLLPSRFEGQPYSIMEALASGLPVLISNSVSREIKLANDMQFLPIDDPKKWVKVLKKIDYKKNNDKRAEKSLKNINVLQKNGYDLETNVDNMLNLYKSFCKNL